jgi:hypothetical protein
VSVTVEGERGEVLCVCVSDGFLRGGLDLCVCVCVCVCVGVSGCLQAENKKGVHLVSIYLSSVCLCVCLHTLITLPPKGEASNNHLAQ